MYLYFLLTLQIHKDKKEFAKISICFCNSSVLVNSSIWLIREISLRIRNSIISDFQLSGKRERERERDVFIHRFKNI